MVTKYEKEKKKKNRNTENTSEVNKSSEIAFDYEILKLDQGSSKHIKKANFWILFSLAILLLAQLFLFNKHFNDFISNIFINFDKKVLIEILYYIGFIGTILISFDIYSSKKLMNFDRKFQKKLKKYYYAAKSALKYSITVSDRNTLDNTYWYRSSLLILFMVYIFYTYDNLYIETITSIASDIEKPFAIMLLSIITVQIVCILDSNDNFNDLIFIVILYLSLDNIFNYYSEYKEYRILYEVLTLYMLIPYLFRSIIFNFETKILKIISWGIIIIGALPYLVIKVFARIIPIVILYPFHLILKISLYLKANMFLRHLGLSLFILAEILKRIFA